MPVQIEPDGSTVVTANRLFFVIAGIRSAATGALLSYCAREWLSVQLLSWSIAAVFGFWTVRSLLQGLFVPGLLSLRFGDGFVEGPKVWWLFRDRVRDEAIDWNTSGERLGRLILQHGDGNQIYTRLAWYAPEDRRAIREQLELRQRRAYFSSASANQH
jgi:hypothetical protein